jgi:hypothetical protein
MLLSRVHNEVNLKKSQAGGKNIAIVNLATYLRYNAFKTVIENFLRRNSKEHLGF